MSPESDNPAEETPGVPAGTAVGSVNTVPPPHTAQPGLAQGAGTGYGAGTVRNTGAIPRLPVHRPSAGASQRPPPSFPATPVAPVRRNTRVPLPVRAFPAPPAPVSQPVPAATEKSAGPAEDLSALSTAAGAPALLPPVSVAGPEAVPFDEEDASELLPVADELPSISPSQGGLYMQPKRIIIIDDDESLTFTFKLAMESRGHIVEMENRGVRAIDAIERFAPDVIFLDIIMPGSDGGEVYNRLRSIPRLASIPVVFLTAMVTREEARQGTVNERGLRYLSKPASIDDVEQAIARIFGL